MNRPKMPIADKAASSYSSHFFGRPAGSIVGIVQGQKLKQVPLSMQAKPEGDAMTELATKSAKRAGKEALWKLAGFAVGSVPIVRAAKIGHGLLVSAIEKRTEELLAEAKADEPKSVRHLLYAAVNYGFNGDGVNAMNIAANGGTAWEHRNSLWVYASVDGDTKPIVYHPCSWQTIYSPILPLRPLKGGFAWQILRQNRTGQRG